VPALKNIRRERFCQLYVKLGNASEAYRQAGFNSKEVNGNACNLIASNSVSSRIMEIQAENDRKSPLSREEALNILAEIARGPRDEFIKASDQERAIEIASRMCGWNEPDEVRLSAANSLTGYLLDLRKESLGAPILEDNVFEVLEDKPKPNNGSDSGLKKDESSDTISASVEAQ
jgi:Terminase small subunit